MGLPVAGFDRKNPLKNIPVLWKLFKSRRMARRIVRDFQPDVCVGVGGYASGPTLNVAQKMGIRTLLQEQNSYAGVTNKLLAKRADRICVAYEGMERFFPADKIVLTGNPVRQALLECQHDRSEARAALGMRAKSPMVLIVGGSLGARTLNESVIAQLNLISQTDIQVLWQTGAYYYKDVMSQLAYVGKPDNLTVTEFVTDMSTAYAAADLVISRAGAGTISELCLLGKPAILVPSPNVAEDHQTKNAMALVARDAALCVKDAEAREALLPLAIRTVQDSESLNRLSANIRAMAFEHSDEVIAREVIALAKR